MWPIDLQRRRERRQGGRPPDDAPGLLLVRARAGAQMVAHACRLAQAAGVRPGMSVAHAHALLKDGTPRVIVHEPPRDASALRALAEWAVRFSPVVAPDPPTA